MSNTDSSSANTPQETGGGTSHQSFAALRHPQARMYLIGSGLAMMADNIEHVISYWIIFEKFHSPALGGFAVIAHWLPFLLFSVYAGALADRFDPRRVIQLGMLLFMAVSFAWGMLFLTDTLEMWHAVVLLVAHGFAGVLWAPAGQMLIHEIVGTAQLQSGVRLFATSRTMGILLGPAVGGGLLLALGSSLGIMLNVLIYLPLILWLWKAPYGKKRIDKNQADRTKARGFADLFSALRQVTGNPTIISMILLAGAASLLVGNAHQAQMPEFASDLGFKESGIYYSLLLAATAGGALIAGVVLESRNLLQARPHTAIILVIMWCFAIGGFAISENFALSLGLLFIAGFLDLAYNSMAQTLVQLNAPVNIRGRVIGLYNMSSLGLRTFSGITVGFGGSLVGIHWSLAASAAVLFIITMTLLSYAVRKVPAKVAV